LFYLIAMAPPQPTSRDNAHRYGFIEYL